MQTLVDVSTASQSHLFTQLISKEGKPCQGLGWVNHINQELGRAQRGQREQRGWSHLTQPSPFLTLCGED